MHFQFQFQKSWSLRQAVGGGGEVISVFTFYELSLVELTVLCAVAAIASIIVILGLAAGTAA